MTPQLRYALVFKLNRDPYRRRDGYAVVRDPRGNFSVFDMVAFTFDAPIEPLELPNCFVGYIDTTHTDVVAKLDALSAGARVPVRLRPVTPTAGGRSELGRAYYRTPPLFTTDYALKNATARVQLARIGCSVSSLSY